jgi:hypothetical protein
MPTIINMYYGLPETLKQKDILAWQTKHTSKKSKKKSIINGGGSRKNRCTIPKICSG